jgi:hypothetical protein
MEPLRGTTHRPAVDDHEPSKPLPAHRRQRGITVEHEDLRELM